MKAFHDMSGSELVETYSEMLATADDLGFKVPENLLYDGEDVDRLMSVCSELDAAIKAFRAGIDKNDEADAPVASPSPLPVSSSKRATKKGTPTSAKSRSPKKAKASEAAPESTPPAPKKEKATKAKTVQKESNMSAAKKAPAKKTTTTTAKKSASPKSGKKATTARKTPAKKAKAAKAKVTRNTARGFADNAKIKVLLEENPCRAGTPRYDRVTNLFKHDGKLVKDFLAKGGKTGTVSYSAKMGWIKVV